MAATLSLSTTMRSALLDSGLNTALGTSPLLKVYSGTEPANADTALSGNTLLGTLTLSSTPFGAASSGVATASSITQDSSADADGTATFCRVTKSDGTVMLQGNAGTSGATFVFATTTITTGLAIPCSSFTVTLPAS